MVTLKFILQAHTQPYTRPRKYYKIYSHTQQNPKNIHSCKYVCICLYNFQLNGSKWYFYCSCCYRYFAATTQKPICTPLTTYLFLFSLMFSYCCCCCCFHFFYLISFLSFPPKSNEKILVNCFFYSQIAAICNYHRL